MADHVIIGASAAGVAAAETLRKNDKKASITIISDEKLTLYSRCLLTYLIAGAIDEEKLIFKGKDFYEKNNIKTLLGKKAISIDPKKKAVTLEGGTTVSYDKLLIATGATPKSVNIPGVDKKGIFTIRKIDEARTIIGMLDGVKEVAVLGGGLIGLRDAYALGKKGKDVFVIVKSPHILSQMVDKGASGVIASTLEKNGIKIMTGLAAKEFLGGDSVNEILLDDGKKLKCQLVIIGKGVKPNTDIASSAGLKVEDGIKVDKFLKTSDKNIFAAGDVAETYDVARQANRINALWPCAVEQGNIAALNMLGKEAAYDGSLSMNSVDFFGLRCISMGITKPKEEGYEIISKSSEHSYKKFVLRNNKIVGMVLVGDIKCAGVVSALIKKGIDVSSVKHILCETKFDYAKIMPLVKKFSDKFKEEEYQDTIASYKP
ncbi:MAG: NAD(P)/FAD-dependent oxidoreductase [Candidatus Omnitrophica bacterium]|nr:NAD(P)/FAD-dependent oxidoreductase [Candidatus Omnitrophota bacterium]